MCILLRKCLNDSLASRPRDCGFESYRRLKKLFLISNKIAIEE